MRSDAVSLRPDTIIRPREIRKDRAQCSGSGGASRFWFPRYLDFAIRPTKPGPESDPSSWRTRLTESPLQVSTTLLLSAFQAQASVSPMMVKLAFPPERSSSTTLPAEVL